jgi:tetratricopeptide (TPR) repeat protein
MIMYICSLNPERNPAMVSLQKQLYTLLFVVMLLSINVHGQGTIDSLNGVLRKTSDPKEQVMLLNKISNFYDYSDPQMALKYALRAEAIAVRSSDYKGYAGSLVRQAKVYYILSDLKNAMEVALKSKEVAESNNLQTELAHAFDALGFICYEIGDEGKSSDYFFASLRIYEKQKDKTGIGQSLCRIGTLYYNQKDTAKAVEYYSRSIDIARELKDEEGISGNISNLATVYASAKDTAKALPLYREALRLNVKMGIIQLIGTTYLNIGNIYLKVAGYDSAMANVLKAKGIFEKLGNQVRLAKTYQTEGEIYLATHQYEESLGAAQKALDISMKNGFKEIISGSAGLLHKIYLQQKDTVKAYHFAMLETQWKDSLFLGEKQKTLARLELQYQFDKREQQVRIQKQRQNFFIIILGLSVIFSILLIILLWSRYRLSVKKALLERQTLEQDLEYKKKELTLNVMSLMKKNEMLSDITKKVVRIKDESSQEETRAALKKVISELRKSTDEQILKEFSLRFREVHKDFYDNLLRKFPDLTPSELKLCAFLRLNMTTKEIAELTGQQISTLENARYRLRQKLGISSSDVNLVTFLTQL